jgi:hypothetical protein
MGTLPRPRVVAHAPLSGTQERAPWEYRGFDLGKIVSTRALQGLFGAHQGSFTATERSGEQYLGLDRHRIKDALHDQEGPLPHSAEIGRSNNSCPAVVSVAGMADGHTSVGLIASQMIDVFKYKGDIFED